MHKLINGDSKEILKQFADNSFHAVITDPPYGINIRKEKWDNSLPELEIWQECYRVLKPGGMIMAFADPRNYHHLACDLEKCGFNTYPLFCWIYPNGFPKGMNLSKEIDKELLRGNPTEEFKDYLRSKMSEKNLSGNKIEQILGIRGMFSHYFGKANPQYPSPKVWEKLKELLDLDNRYDEIIYFKRNKSHLSLVRENGTSYKYLKDNFNSYTPKTDEGKLWDEYRYGAASIKPALTPIYVGQKPFKGKFVKNFMTHNTGAINTKGENYPCNVLMDSKIDLSEKNYFENITADNYEYCSKSVVKEKGEYNNHPTVKPIDLMKRLIHLTVPKGGKILDPFCGSGTTLIAANLEGVESIGIEKEYRYYQIAHRRLLELNEDVSYA